ncbi:hypothetical protein ACFLYA_00925 [Candidatus Dependentiae bacterium]
MKKKMIALSIILLFGLSISTIKAVKIFNNTGDPNAKISVILKFRTRPFDDAAKNLDKLLNVKLFRKIEKKSGELEGDVEVCSSEEEEVGRWDRKKELKGEPLTCDLTREALELFGGFAGIIGDLEDRKLVKPKKGFELSLKVLKALFWDLEFKVQWKIKSPKDGKIYCCGTDRYFPVFFSPLKSPTWLVLYDVKKIDEEMKVKYDIHRMGILLPKTGVIGCARVMKFETAKEEVKEFTNKVTEGLKQVGEEVKSGWKKFWGK